MRRRFFMKNLLYSILLAGLVFSLLTGNTFAGEEQKLNTQIVRIQGNAGVSPLNLSITPGTVVVWLNDYRITPVEVMFPDKKVTMACQSPVNFSISKDGTYVSNSIPYGGVASLCFIEPGTFKYVIERARPQMMDEVRGNPFRFEGQIVVKKQ
jgi:plastocyanin